MTARAMTDLPEPDSPTTQRISFSARSRLTPSTAWGRSAQTGSATYNGHIIGNVTNNGASYLAAGAFSHTWSFADHTGSLAITNFDTNKNFPGSTAATTGVNFAGTFSGSGTAAGINGQLNGSFFKSPTDPVAYQAGQFTMTNNTNYVAGGTFAAQKVAP